MIVTAVERQPRRRRVNVYVDGHFACAIGLDLAAERDLRPGRTISEGELRALQAEEERRRAYEAALRLLAYRLRSEHELRERLRRKGFPRPVVQATLERLRRLGYLNDADYARFWTETRQATRPRSRRLATFELLRQGIAAPTAEQATAAIEDEPAAYDAASRRLRVLRGLDYPTFRQRLGSFLARRGFSYEVARRTIDRCWQELTAAPPPDEPSEH